MLLSTIIYTIYLKTRGQDGGVQNKGNTTFFSNVKKMTGEGLQPIPLKWLVPKISTSYHSAILPVCFLVNIIDDCRRYHLQVFNIKDRILCIALSTKCQEWDSNPRHRNYCYPSTSASYHSAILPVCYEVNRMDYGRRYHLQVFNIKDTILCIALSTKC